MAVETELKLSIAAADAARLDEVPVVREHQVGDRKTGRLVNVYYDTPELKLLERGYGLRLREQNGRWRQTVKREGTVAAGLQCRPEWEHELAGQALELERFDDPALRAVLDDPGIRGGLGPCFTTDFRRTVRDLRFADGTVIEMAVDVGTIRAGERACPLAEVELELKNGAPYRVFETAHAIHVGVPVRILHQTKAERGYALISPPPPPAATKAGRVELAPGITADGVFQTVLWHTLDHLLRNEPVVLENPADIEGVHQMRVATRRMRSCLRVFRPLISRPVASLLNARVRWLTDALGPARDWDVLIDETLEPLGEQQAGGAALEKLRDRANRCREEAYAAVREALLSPRYTELMLTLAAWIEAQSWRGLVDGERRAQLDRPAIDLARELLEKRHTEVMERGKRFDRLTVEERHDLRIRGKRLRYLAEFFAGLWGAEQVRPFTRALSRLQDVLGALNDAAVARRLLADVTDGAGDPAGNLVLGWKAAVTAACLADFGAAWKAFSAAEPYWRD